MSLSRLPNELLSAIVKRLPIGDLIQVGLVSHRLYHLQQSLLPSALLTASSIRIDIGPPNNEIITELVADFYRINEPHRVMVKLGEDNLNRSIYDLVVRKHSMQALATTFPNIKRLTVVLYYRYYRTTSVQIENSIALLSFWPNLIKLTMVGCLDRSYSIRRQMVRSINELKSLKALAMDMPLYQLSLSIYGQLEVLTCQLQKTNAGIDEKGVRACSHKIIEMMTLYPNIATVGLWVMWACGYVDYSNWPSQVTNRITRLVHLDGATPAAKASLDVICGKFSSLTYLYFATELTFASALPSLAKLKHLQKLNLAIRAEPLKKSNLPLLESVKQVNFLTPLDPHQLGAFDAFFPNALRVGFVVTSFHRDSFRKLLCHNKHCANCAFLKLYYFVDEPWPGVKSTRILNQDIRVWLD